MVDTRKRRSQLFESERYLKYIVFATSYLCNAR